MLDFSSGNQNNLTLSALDFRNTHTQIAQTCLPKLFPQHHNKPYAHTVYSMFALERDHCAYDILTILDISLYRWCRCVGGVYAVDGVGGLAIIRGAS